MADKKSKKPAGKKAEKKTAKPKAKPEEEKKAPIVGVIEEAVEETSSGEGNLSDGVLDAFDPEDADPSLEGEDGEFDDEDELGEDGFREGDW